MQSELLQQLQKQLVCEINCHQDGDWKSNNALEKALNEITPIVINLGRQSQALLSKAVIDLSILSLLAKAIVKVPVLQIKLLVKILELVKTAVHYLSGNSYDQNLVFESSGEILALVCKEFIGGQNLTTTVFQDEDEIELACAVIDSLYSYQKALQKRPGDLADQDLGTATFMPKDILLSMLEYCVSE